MRAVGMTGLGVLDIEPTRAWARSIPKSLEEGGTDNDRRARKRKNILTVGVASGLMSRTNLTCAEEMAEVLDDGDNLRVLPMVTYGAASLYEGVDLKITQSDVLEYFRAQCKTANPEGRLHCIPYLRTSEIHVLASTDMDLRVKKAGNSARPEPKNSERCPVLAEEIAFCRPGSGSVRFRWGRLSSRDFE